MMNKMIRNALILLVVISMIVGSANGQEEGDIDPRSLIEKRIIGGSRAPNNFKFMVALFKPDRNSPTGELKIDCGGSLIHPRWVLTAGHCVKYKIPPTKLIVGYQDLNSHERMTNNVFVKSELTVYLAKDYTGTTNDMALIHLPRPVAVGGSAAARVIPLSVSGLNKGYEEVGGDNTYVAGWGTRAFGVKSTERNLNWVQVPVVDQDKCKNAYGSRIRDNNICAGYDEGKKDSCSGDSGGPLFSFENGQYVQIGIVSFGRYCGYANAYGVYSRVSSFVDEINQIIQAVDESQDDLLTPEQFWSQNGPEAPKEPTPLPTRIPTKSPTVAFCNKYRNDQQACIADRSCAWIGQNRPRPCIKKMGSGWNTGSSTETQSTEKVNSNEQPENNQENEQSSSTTTPPSQKDEQQTIEQLDNQSLTKENTATSVIVITITSILSVGAVAIFAVLMIRKRAVNASSTLTKPSALSTSSSVKQIPNNSIINVV